MSLEKIKGEDYKKRYIKSVSDYLELIRALGHDHARGRVSVYSESRFAFRGQTDCKYSLLPGLFRYIYNEEGGERQYSAPEPFVLRTFIKEAIAVYDRFSEDDAYHWIQIAQHYGVPTRLLDWTNNSLVGLYFACNAEEKKEGVVWVLNKERYLMLSKDEHGDKVFPKELLTNLLDERTDSTIYPKYPVIFNPYYFDVRMSAQSSMFMAWGREQFPLEKLLSDHFIRLSDIPANVISQRLLSTTETIINTSRDCIFPIYVCGEDKRSINEELSTMGINEKTLFPGLDGIGKYIQRRFDKRTR